MTQHRRAKWLAVASASLVLATACQATVPNANHEPATQTVSQAQLKASIVESPKPANPEIRHDNVPRRRIFADDTETITLGTDPSWGGVQVFGGWEAQVPGANWIWRTADHDDGGTTVASKSFDVPTGAVILNAWVDYAFDDRGSVYVNDEFAGSTNAWWIASRADVKNLIHVGENTVRLIGTNRACGCSEGNSSALIGKITVQYTTAALVLEAGFDDGLSAFSPNADDLKDELPFTVKADPNGGEWALSIDGAGEIRRGKGNLTTTWNGQVNGIVLPDGKYTLRLTSTGTKGSHQEVIVDTKPPSVTDITFTKDKSDASQRTYKLSAKIDDHNLSGVNKDSIEPILDETQISVSNENYDKESLRYESIIHVDGALEDIYEDTDVIIEVFDNASNSGIEQASEQPLFDALLAYLPGSSPWRAYSLLGTPKEKGTMDCGVGGTGGNVSGGPPPGIANSCAPQGGTYVHINPLTRQVVRVGRTNNLARRQLEHKNNPALKKYDFKIDVRSNNKSAVRGREQTLYNKYNPPLNKIRPINPKNKNIKKYHTEEGAEAFPIPKF